MVTKTYYVGDCNYPGYYATFSNEIAAHDYSDFIDDEEFVFEDHDGRVRPY